MDEKMKIPRKIHYVWLGGKQLTASASQCIDSWKRAMPHYEIKCWNDKNFDVDSVIWVKEAIEKKKWSLASDYIRHYAVYNEGGIYLDTDITVLRPFDDLLDYRFFCGIEYHSRIFKKYGKKQVDDNGIPLTSGIGIRGIGLLAAAFGATSGHPFIKDCMDFFAKHHYVNADGSLFEDIINPDIMAHLLVKYGFRYQDKLQHLSNNMLVVPSNFFLSDISHKNKNSYLIHWCNNSWRKEQLNWKGKLYTYLKARYAAFYRRIL